MDLYRNWCDNGYQEITDQHSHKVAGKVVTMTATKALFNHLINIYGAIVLVSVIA